MNILCSINWNYNWAHLILKQYFMPIGCWKYVSTSKILSILNDFCSIWCCFWLHDSEPFNDSPTHLNLLKTECAIAFASPEQWMKHKGDSLWVIRARNFLSTIGIPLNLCTSANLLHLKSIFRGFWPLGCFFGVKFASLSHRCFVVLCSVSQCCFSWLGISS